MFVREARGARREFLLAVLGAVVASALVILAGRLAHLLRTPALDLDQDVAAFFHAARRPAILPLFSGISLLGEWPLVFLAAAVASAVLWVYQQRAVLVPFWVTLAGSELFSFLAKVLLGRARPDGALAAALEDSFSFPSGHATIAVAFYGFLAYLLWRRSRTRQQRIVSVFLGVGLPVVIGLSRLILGVHYASDVAGGFLLGTVWLLAGIRIAEEMRRHP